MSERQASLGKMQRGASSKYKGVSKNKKNGTWRASIRPRGESFFIGDFETEKDASLAFNEAARRFFGAAAFLNNVSGENFKSKK